MNNTLLQNPKILLIGAVGIFAAFILLRNQNKSESTGQQNVGTNFGVGEQYLDGIGLQHIIATDPYGYMTGYSSPEQGLNSSQTNQLASYIGSMGHGQNIPYIYGGTSPTYAGRGPEYADIQRSPYNMIQPL